MTKRNMLIGSEMWDKMVVVSKKYGCSVSALIRRAIYEFLQREEGE